MFFIPEIEYSDDLLSDSVGLSEYSIQEGLSNTTTLQRERRYVVILKLRDQMEIQTVQVRDGVPNAVGIRFDEQPTEAVCDPQVASLINSMLTAAGVLFHAGC